jgi:hypothetical protein
MKKTYRVWSFMQKVLYTLRVNSFYWKWVGIHRDPLGFLMFHKSPRRQRVSHFHLLLHTFINDLCIHLNMRGDRDGTKTF